jgi:hypothetical protein
LITSRHAATELVVRSRIRWMSEARTVWDDLQTRLRGDEQDG